MALLKRAVAAVLTPYGVARLKDPDFGALRGREDFKALVAELERKQAAAEDLTQTLTAAGQWDKAAAAFTDTRADAKAIKADAPSAQWYAP